MAESDSATSELRRLRWPRAHTIAFLCIGYLAAAVHGSLQNLDRLALDWILSLLMAQNLALWAVRDSQCGKRPIPLLSRQWFLIGAWRLVPGYAIYSRRWRGLSWVLLHGVGWYLAFIAGHLIVYCVWMRDSGY